ncbi:hypothetical protein [Desulfofundulus thermocisternus]|uniref:hypothetical protein n=1 Tax=Desulfofundulus thermocisternus TaxID=42471 RepID=UPI0019E0ACE4|nr:hypothetical protein [Desulfofundulus thermocisternus]MBE3586010.1 hypothetical protein [Thermoanaerobacter sp.]MCS5695068.1 hypothetical protein [Desulfofundulus thermocisternus]
MCVDREMFVNKRTAKDGYINLEEPLTPTQYQDLKLAVKWLKCRYNFGVEDIAELLGIDEDLIREVFDKLPCNRCNVILHRRPEPQEKQPAPPLIVPRPKGRKRSVGG